MIPYVLSPEEVVFKRPRPMISYAQNAEDVLLRRVFGARSEGLYVDVGAYDPVFSSVSKHFYDLGWSGLNIDASPAACARVAAARPRDKTLNFGVSSRRGTMPFFEAPPGFAGLSTFVSGHAEKHRSRGVQLQEISVEVRTLAELCEEHTSGPIDFMSIDVEGHEREVIEGADFTRFRPRVLLVEAIEPLSTSPSYEQWEPLLYGEGYRFAAFDGLNRYYLPEELHADLAPRLAVPANVFDHFVPYEYWRQIVELRGVVDRFQADERWLVKAARRVQALARRARDAMR